MQVWVSIDGKVSAETIVRKTRYGYRGGLGFTQRTNWSTIYRWNRWSPITRLTKEDALLDVYAELQDIA
jgi:hypothetical protein